MIALGALVRPAVALAAVVGVHGLGGHGVAGARSVPVSSLPASSAPSVTLDRAEGAPGEAVLVSLTGFGEGAVTVAICGNLGRRGSGDCDMQSARGEGTGPTGRVAVARLMVRPPPTPCPCVVRASSTNGDLAVAPFVVRGHPVAPVVDPIEGALVAVSIDVEGASRGLVDRLRASLGGPARYAVTVSVRNLTAGTITKLALEGSARHRFDDDAAKLDLEKPPSELGSGRTWEQTVEVELPALVVGRLTWTAVASGAGSPVEAERVISNTPVALYLLGGVLVTDIGAMAWRWRTRRRRSRRQGRGRVAGVSSPA